MRCLQGLHSIQPRCLSPTTACLTSTRRKGLKVLKDVAFQDATAELQQCIPLNICSAFTVFVAGVHLPALSISRRPPTIRVPMTNKRLEGAVSEMDHDS